MPATLGNAGVLWRTIGLVAAGLVTAVIGVLGAIERLPRNRLVGIRTPQAVSSPEVWAAVHRVSGPWLVAAGLSLIAGALCSARPGLRTPSIAAFVAAVACVTVAMAFGLSTTGV